MVGLALREFECALCRERFTQAEIDLILPIPRLCDACLKAVWDLEGNDLTEHIAGCIKKEASGLGGGPESKKEREFEKSIVKYIQFHRQQWGSADGAVWARERDRLAFGKA